ncbi:MAG TPA: aminopeptidase [Eubacteriales bacterium]|nr:aminopeptidase [Eubacteriales bacterium]HRU84750.1 aminopeptidase [Eubacteriales bacterium]
MENLNEMLKKYAELVIKVGVNLQDKEELVINADVETAVFARMLAEAGYRGGAKCVDILWRDQLFKRMRAENEEIATLTDIPDWLIKSRDHIVDRKAAYIAIVSDDPEIFKGIAAEKPAAISKANSIAFKRFYDASMSNEIRWCLVAYPNTVWAKKISPNLTEKEAVDKLWELIFKTMRLDVSDSVKAWKKHQARLNKICDILTKKQFKTLRYKNSLGTDFSIGLPQGYFFSGGLEKSRGGVEFSANMPTEEVFTAPDRKTANGKVVASMPLFHNGNRIDKFGFTFENGKVVDFFAETGYDVLKALLDTDEGAKYLGEVALVQYDSPIQNLKTLFYNTLFDENASCHFALGKAYPCIEGSEKMTEAELAELGLNDSLEHVDFMVGTEDLSIIGIDAEGEKTVIFKDGNFAI